MKNFYKKYKIQIFLVGYLLFLGAFIYGGIFLTVKNIQSAADEIQKKIIDNEEDKKNLSKIPQLMADYETFSAEEQNLSVILRKESEIEFIKSLEDLAKETGNEISLKLIEEEGSDAKEAQRKAKAKEKEKNKEDIETTLPYQDYITIQLEIKGKYSDLMKFLRKVENMEYYTNVVSLNLKKEEKQMEENSRDLFVGSPRESVTEEPKKEEILKSLIDLIVYIR